MNDEPRLNSYTQIIELIFTDAQESIKVLDSRVNILNTQLSAVAGFSAALIKFAGDLPDQSILIQDSLPCYSCSVLKILSLLLLVASAGISLIGILQKQGGQDSIISPNEQVEKWGITVEQVSFPDLGLITTYRVMSDGKQFVTPLTISQ
jgi:hypothetical protein